MISIFMVLQLLNSHGPLLGSLCRRFMDLFDSLSFGDLLQGPNATRTVAYLRRVLERVSTEHRVHCVSREKASAKTSRCWLGLFFSTIYNTSLGQIINTTTMTRYHKDCFLLTALFCLP